MSLFTTRLVKIISASAILVFLALEFWNIYLSAHNGSVPSRYHLLLMLGNIMLIAHGIEGLIAVFKANQQQKNPLTYGVYTFFVGFPGLRELDSSSQ